MKKLLLICLFLVGCDSIDQAYKEGQRFESLSLGDIQDHKYNETCKDLFLSQKNYLKSYAYDSINSYERVHEVYKKQCVKTKIKCTEADYHFYCA